MRPKLYEEAIYTCGNCYADNPSCDTCDCAIEVDQEFECRGKKHYCHKCLPPEEMDDTEVLLFAHILKEQRRNSGKGCPWQSIVNWMEERRIPDTWLDKYIHKWEDLGIFYEPTLGTIHCIND